MNADLPAVIPWWTLNGAIAEDEARRQLDDFLAKGIREFFLYPNFGLESPDFLSEEWFGFIAFLLRECPPRRMRFWLYDELNWPSGSAAGRFLRDFPQYRMRTIRRREHTLAPGETWTPAPNAEYLWAGVFHAPPCAAPAELPADQPYANRSDAPVRLVALEKWLVDDHFLCSMGTSGTWNQPGILDALNPAAVRAWMGYNYEPYRQRFPQELGRTIRGFFFDEPTMVSPFHTCDVPWTPGLEALFRERYGYDCRPLLWALFEPAPDHAQFRYDFWRLASRRFADAFTGQLAAWCHENRVLLSGHCWPEEPSCQRLMTTATGDIHDLQRHLDLPGTDFLYCENNFAERAGMCPDTPGWARNLIYSAKHASSTARYNGARHTICESSGIATLGGTPAPPSAQKTALDFLYAMGLSVMNPARPYDMTEFRKHACAPDAAQPYWKHYAHLHGYMERVAAFNARGRADTRLAVLNPVSAKFALSDITPDTSIRRERTPLPPHADCASAMLATIDALVRSHRDFEFLFEDVLLDSPVSPDGGLRAPESDFRMILLPQCHALDDAVWTRLQEFADAGGHLLVIGEAPALPLRHGRAPIPVHPLPAPALAWDAPGFADRLDAAIDAVLPREVRLDGGEEVLSLLRRDGDWQALFLANATPGEKHVRLLGPFADRAASITDLQTGAVSAWRPGTPLRLMETHSFLLSTDAPPDGARPFTQERRLLQELPATGWRFAGTVRNTARVRLECSVGGGFRPIDGNGAADFPLDPDQTPSVTLRGTFEIQGAVPPDLRLWFDHDGFTDLVVNGAAVAARTQEPLLDPRNAAAPVAAHCRLGENTFTVTAPLTKWLKARYGIREHFTTLLQGLTPPFLMGAFRVVGDAAVAPLPDTLACGPLEAQGFPQFADELAVETRFDCGAPAEAVELGLDAAPLPVTAILNGVCLGTRLWRQGALPIPDGLLRPQGNRLGLRLCGDIWNLLQRRWLGTPIPGVPFTLPNARLLTRP